MSNIIRSTTQTALLFISQYLNNGDTVIDATCGNGHDTLAMAKLGAGKIYAFDVQDTAIKNTEALLQEENIPLDKVHLILDSHANMCNYIKEKVRVIVFNLGYLPGADKSVTTTADSTVCAVKYAVENLSENGYVSICAYLGHEGAVEEFDTLSEYLSSLKNREYNVSFTKHINRRSYSPVYILVEKL
jgi:tRNA G37 N-methylase Trm5